MRSPALDVELIRTGMLPPAERRAAERAAKAGTLQRIRPGVLVAANATQGFRPSDHHLLLIRAALTRIHSGRAISHVSAGILHGLPLVGAQPPKVHLADPGTTHTVVTAWFVRHGAAERPPPVQESPFGVPVTSVARAVVDSAATLPLHEALPGVDHALRSRSTTADELEFEARRLNKGRSKADLAVRLGSAGSESPAESVCRARFHVLGLRGYEQQHAFDRPGERRTFVDFWFPEHGVVVEVDGRTKYEDPAMLAGQTTAQAHWEEKQREDFIRSFREVRGFVRLTWRDLMDTERLRVKLARAGLPC